MTYVDIFNSTEDFLRGTVDFGFHGSNKRDPRLVFSASAGLSGSMPSEGGFVTVPTETAAGIWERSNTVGPILRRLTRQPITIRSGAMTLPAIDERSRANGSRYGGISLSWIPEGESFPEFTPTFGNIGFRPKLLGGVMHVTNELLSDFPAFAGWFERTAANEVAFITEDAVVNGTGSGQPLGILNSDAVIEVTPESGQAAATISAANLQAMIGRFWAGGFESPGAAWLMGVDVFEQLLSKTWATGAPVITTEAGSRYIAGWPALVGEYTPAVGTRGDIVLSDLSQWILSEREFGVPASLHLKFLSDESSLKIRTRLDGSPAWAGPVTPKNSSGVTQAPFVVVGNR